MAEKNGNVKWPVFLGTILAIFALMFRIASISVSDGEFVQFEKRIEVQFESINKNLVFLRDDIRALKK